VIVTCEGLDRSGKTTLVEQLASRFPFAVRAPHLPVPISLKPVMREVEAIGLSYWKAFYQPGTLVLADRCPFVSNCVYAEVYGRPPVDYPEWRSEVRVLWCRPPHDVLLARGDDPWHPDMLKEPEVYDRVVPRFEHATLSDPATMLEEATAAVHRWLAEEACSHHGTRERIRYLLRQGKRTGLVSSLRRELLELQVAECRRRILELRAYWRGSFGQLLGLPAVGPCRERQRLSDNSRMLADASHPDILRALPPKPSGGVLLHRCDNRFCWEPLHLSWGTQRDNVRDMQLKGRRKGVDHAELLRREQTKLSELVVQMATCDGST
jgi:hypothetical protein